MLVGKYAGLKVFEAKPLVRADMVAEGLALQYWEPESLVMSRSVSRRRRASRCVRFARLCCITSFSLFSYSTVVRNVFAYMRCCLHSIAADVLLLQGDECVVAELDQWFLKYGDEDWKNGA